MDLVRTPASALPLNAALDRAAEGPGTVTVGDRTRTWAELRDDSRRLAAGLAGSQIGPGDRVASIMTDGLESLEIAFATAAIGALWVPLGPHLRGDFLGHQLRTADPAMLIADAPAAKESAPMLRDLRGLQHFIALDRLADQHREHAIEPVTDGRTPAAILFTSGTTGSPKGCIVSQGYFVKAGWCYRQTLAIEPDDVIFTAFPLFHGAALAVAMMAVVAGASFHHPGAFSATTYMRDATQAGATVAVGTGGMATALMARPPAADDAEHSLRVVEWVPLGADAQHTFAERFGVRVYAEHYGQTECMIATQTPLPEARNPGSAGRASPLVDLAILDEEGHPVPPGTVGEIAIRPRTTGAMYDGYWRDPEATVAAWEGLWHHTGDAGTISDDGVLGFIDRRSDSLRRRGENISSLQLEAAIREHPDIQDAAVHAVPSDMTEDDIKACLVPVSGATLDPRELFGFFARSLPYYAVPRYVEVIDELPRTGNHKVRKDQLRVRGLTASTWDFEALGLTIARDARRAAVSSRASAARCSAVSGTRRGGSRLAGGRARLPCGERSLRQGRGGRSLRIREALERFAAAGVAGGEGDDRDIGTYAAGKAASSPSPRCCTRSSVTAASPSRCCAPVRS